MRRRYLILLALPLLAGCVALLPARSRVKGAPPQVASKVVVDKREPVYLVAGDGTTCEVSRKQFERVRIGDDILCAWY